MQKYFSILLSGILFVMTGFVFVAHADPDTSPPTQPGAPSASITVYGTVSLSWGASTDDVGVTGYYVYRDGGSVGSTSNTSFTDQALPGAYTYTVAAYDAAGNVSKQSPASGIVSVVQDTTPPSTPMNLTATSGTSTITISWDASTDNVGVVGYYLSKNNNRLPLSTDAPYTATSYTDTGLLPGTTYSYAVTAYDAAGNLSSGVRVSTTTLTAINSISDTTPPSVPSFITVIPVSQGEIDVRWQTSTDNVGTTGYNVYRDGNLIGNATSSSYKDTGLAADTTHTYAMNAYDAAGNISATSNGVSGTTFVPDTSPPSMPAFLTATPLSTSSIKLSWQPSFDNVGVTGYSILQGGTQVATVSSSLYVSTGLASGTSYVYNVYAYDAAGNTSTYAFANAATLFVSPVTSVAVPAPAATSTPVPVPPVSIPVAPTATGGTGGTTLLRFTATLVYGSYGVSVAAVQKLLIENQYLGPDRGTGFYGSLTQKAVQQFQCVQSIICMGAPSTTGWGNVGPKTRKALNTL